MRLIDADKLCSYLNDVSLAAMPDEWDEGLDFALMKAEYETIRKVMDIVDEQPMVYYYAGAKETPRSVYRTDSRFFSAFCPVCDTGFKNLEEVPNYCPMCGQRLKRSEM